MSLIVQKFGGTSVANAERVMNVAKIVTDTYAKGNDVVVVVSAQGDFTDVLVDKQMEINPKASKREQDMLLAAGEQISIALLAMAIEKLGYHVTSLLGWQAGFETSSAHTAARIKRVDPSRIQEAIDRRNIVVVAGFQGLDPVSEGREIGAQGDLKVTLLWDNDSVDLDLHILEPNGFEICYKDGQRSDPRTGGELDIDWIPGNNAGQPIGENIYWQHPPKGQYKVWVECYQPETAPPTSCNVIVYRVNQEPRVYNAQTQCVHDVQQITTITVE